MNPVRSSSIGVMSLSGAIVFLYLVIWTFATPKGKKKLDLESFMRKLNEGQLGILYIVRTSGSASSKENQDYQRIVE